MVEMTYHLPLNAAMGPELKFLGATLDTTAVSTWVGAGVFLLIGLALFELARRKFARQWSDIQEEIEHQIKRGEAL